MLIPHLLRCAIVNPYSIFSVMGQGDMLNIIYCLSMYSSVLKIVGYLTGFYFIYLTVSVPTFTTKPFFFSFSQVLHAMHYLQLADTYVLKAMTLSLFPTPEADPSACAFLNPFLFA